MPTLSERILTRIASSTFLDHWCYPNPHRDQQQGGRGTGKEICDLLVVFAPHIVIFSDKYVPFQEQTDLGIAWKRWYSRAVLASAKQLAGAERWLREHPDRVFVDAECAKVLPVSIPRKDEAIFHRIVVANGIGSTCGRHLGNDGSLIFDSGIGPNAPLAKTEPSSPFVVGLPDRKHFVHVFDEVTMPRVVEELNTIRDFTQYLLAKEDFVGRAGRVVSAGEHETLGFYLLPMKEFGSRSFPATSGRKTTHYIPPRYWDLHKGDVQRTGKLAHDEDSRIWDRFINFFSEVVKKTPHPTGASLNKGDPEVCMRLLAGESRFARRRLAEALTTARQRRRQSPSKALARRMPSPDQPGLMYCFYITPECKTSEDWDKRQKLLQFNCERTVAEFGANIALGLAMDDRGWDEAPLFTAMVLRRDDLSDDDLRAIRQTTQEVDVMIDRKPKKIQHLAEFPLAPYDRDGRRQKAGRNSPCPCGSGEKYKRCCGSPA